MSIRKAIMLAVVTAVLLTGDSGAFINPNFTPIHVTKQSSLILEIAFARAKDGKAEARVKRVMKGKLDSKTVTFNLTTTAIKGQIDSVGKLMNGQGDDSAIFFVGEYSLEGAGGGGGMGGGEPPPEEGKNGNAQKAFLHIGGQWALFYKGKDGDWELDALNSGMLTTWNGSSDMLIAATDYILADPDSADLPVVEGVQWAGHKRFAKLDGAVGAIMPVDLEGNGNWALHVACDTGDRLLRYDAKEANLVDVSRAVKLTARSKIAAWADFNGDGKMDLLSWNGESMVIHMQGADGTFAAHEEQLKGALPNGCLSLAVVDCGKAGKPGVVIGTRTSPILWVPGARDSRQDIGGAFTGAGLGSPGPCLVADFDGDSIPDIVQLFEKGSLIYAGKALGQFDNGRPGKAWLGKGAGGAFLGDYDADGRLDFFSVAADDASHLWHNRGNLQFVDAIAGTGELTYKGNSAALGGMTGDFNNDGRQDMFFYYGSMGPQLYFNRGFSSFGFCNGIDPSINGLLPQGGDGAQAGCLADVNGDGGQDMIVVLKNGEAWAFYVAPNGGAGRCVRVALSSKGSYVGPLTVTGWRGNRCLGAWNVTAGTSEAFVGVQEAGPVTVKWQIPGGTPQFREAIVENKPVRIVVGQ